MKWGSNPRLRRDSNLSRAPWTTRPFNRGGARCCQCRELLLPPPSKSTRRSETPLRTKMCAVRESNPGLVRGRDLYYHCTNGALLVPRIELGTSCVLSRRHNQLDHTGGLDVSWSPPRPCPARGIPDLSEEGGRPGGPLQCVHSTRAVFHPSKVKIRVRVPMDALVLHCNTQENDAWPGDIVLFLANPREFRSAPKKGPPTVGIEPTTTRLKVLRSTTELGGTALPGGTRCWTAAPYLPSRVLVLETKMSPPLGIEPRT